MVCFGLTATAHAACYVSDCTSNLSNNVGNSSMSNNPTTQFNTPNNTGSSYRSNKSNSSTTRFNPPNNTGGSYRSNSSMTPFNPLGDTAYSYKSNITTTRLTPFKGISHSSSSHSSAMSAYDPYGDNSLTNPYATAGSSAIPDDPYGNNSLTNPYAANNLRPYARQSRHWNRSGYRGKPGKKSYIANSISNPYDNYGVGNPYTLSSH